MQTTKKQQLAMLVLGMTAALAQGARLQNIAQAKPANAELAEVNEQNNLAQAGGCGGCGGGVLKCRRVLYAIYLKSYEMF
jgi:hypothetical protein